MGKREAAGRALFERDMRHDLDAHGIPAEEWEDQSDAAKKIYREHAARGERGCYCHAPADVEICGAELNADSRPCQSARGHSGDHWTPSDQADKPAWWSTTEHEIRGKEHG